MTQFTLTSDSYLNLTINSNTYKYSYSGFDPTLTVPYRFNIGSAAINPDVPVNVYIFAPSVWNSDWTVTSGIGIAVFGPDKTFISTTSSHYIKKDYHGVATLNDAINIQCMDDPPTTSGAIGVPGHTILSECPKSVILTDSRLSGGCGIELIKDYDSTKTVNYDDIKVKVVYHGMAIVPDTFQLVRSGTYASLATPSNVPSNYTFGGWSTAPGGNKALSVVVDKFTDLYAIWTLNGNNERWICATTSSGNDVIDILAGAVPNFYVDFSIQPEWQKYITIDRFLASQNIWMWRIFGLPANCTYTASSMQGTVTFKTYDGRTIMTVSNPSAGGYTYKGAIGTNNSLSSHVYHMTKNVTNYSVRFETVDLDGNALNGVIWYNNNSKYSANTFSNGVTVSGIPETYRYEYSQDSSTDVDHIFKIVDKSGSQIGSNNMDAQILEQYRNSYEFVRYEQSSLGSGNIRIRVVLTPKGSGGSGGWPSPGTQMWYKFRITYKWGGQKDLVSGTVKYQLATNTDEQTLPAGELETIDTVAANQNISSWRSQVLKFAYVATAYNTVLSPGTIPTPIYPSSIKAHVYNRSGADIPASTFQPTDGNGVGILITAGDINNALVDNNLKFLEDLCRNEGSGTESDPYVAKIYFDIT